MLNPFSWVRTMARNAFMAGVGDAMQTLATSEAMVPAMTLDDLRQRLALAAPESEPATETRARRLAR